MNKKGFTVIELLATIVIIAIVGSIATVSVISIINTSKSKSEKIFVDKLSNLIDDYLDLNQPTKVTGSPISFNKCKNATCSNTYSVTATKLLKEDSSKIYLRDLIDANFIEQDELVNPKNKTKCLSDSELGPEIIIYKDSEYVLYYYVDLTNSTRCDISHENGIINTLPDNLSSEVGLS